MLTSEGRNNLIASLLNADNSEIVEALITDINELVETLGTVGAISEEGENATFTATAIEEPEITEDYKTKYEELQKKFVARFMNKEIEEPEVIDTSEETEETTDENITMDSLFKEED